MLLGFHASALPLCVCVLETLKKVPFMCCLQPILYCFEKKVSIQESSKTIVTPGDQKHQKWEIEYFELITCSLYTHNDENFQQVFKSFNENSIFCVF